MFGLHKFKDWDESCENIPLPLFYCSRCKKRIYEKDI